MMPYVFFLDIDGTIFHDKTVSKKVSDTIQTVRKLGHKVYINTGRAPSYLPQVVKELPVDGFVCGCGGYILRENDSPIKHFVSKDATIRLCRRFSAPDDPGILIEGEKKLFRYRTSRWAPGKDWILGDTIEEVAEYLKTDNVVKININDDIDPKIIPELEQDFAVTWHPTEYYTECCVKGCSKTTGIQAVMEFYRLPMAQSVAIGDSENDLDMLQSAGIGVVMGQAREEIKAVADIITDSVEKDGAATAMERIVAGDIVI